MSEPRTYWCMPSETRQVYDDPEAVCRYSHRFLWPVEQHLCSTYLLRPGKLLDIGCAAGRMSIPLGQKGNFEVVGLDISFNQVKEASEAAGCSQVNCSFFQGDMRTLALCERTVDYVFITYTSIGALTLPEDRERCAREVSRVLKPDGIAFISVWNRLWPGRWGSSWAKWVVLWLLRVVRANGHGRGNRVCWEAGGYVLWHYFFFGEARSLFRKAGLDVLAVVPFEGSWTDNHVCGNSWWSRHFSEGLYFVLSRRTMESPERQNYPDDYGNE
jgi:SAM-dependent methyltransferase